MRERQAAFKSNQGTYRPPLRSRCDEQERVLSAWRFESLDPIVKTWRQSGSLVEFQITLRIRIEDQWRTVFEVDCKHGHVHSHVTTPETGRGEGIHIYRLDGIADVKKGFNRALQLTYDFAETYIEGTLTEGRDHDA